MSAAIVDRQQDEQTQAWWYMDLLMVEHRRVPDMASVVLELTMPVGHAPPLHVHHDLDDAWYIVEGEMVVRCGDELMRAGAGDWISMPRGVPHTLRIVGDHAARILLVHDNATFRDLIRDLGRPAEVHTVPPHPVFPSMEDLTRVAALHDLSPAGPPISVEDAETALAATL